MWSGGRKVDCLLRGLGIIRVRKDVCWSGKGNRSKLEREIEGAAVA